MVLTLDPPGTPAPRSDPRTTTVRLRSRYIDARDSTVTVAIYVGDPPVLVNGCVVEEVAWSWASTTDNGVVTVTDAGGGTLTLWDPARRYDPTNEESTDLLTKIGTRVQIVVAGVPAFTGRVDDVAHDLTTARIALVDDVSALASIQFVETAVPAETAAARINRILDLAAWPATKRDVTAGGVAMQAGTVAADAWSELVEVNRNELGALWIRPDGVLSWRPRTSAWLGGAPVMTFGCPPSDVPLVALATRADQGDLVNILSAARRTGTQRTVTDSASLATYGRHTHVQNDLELAADVDRDSWQDFYIRRQALPARGVAGFACRPGAAAIAKALALPFGAIVRVVDSGHGPDIDRPARWVGSRWTIAPDRVELVAITGEDASIRQVDRFLTLDLAADFDGALPLVTMGDLLGIGSFEQDLTGWTLSPAATAATTPVDAANAVLGTKVLRLAGQATAVVNPGVNTLLTTPLAMPVVPGLTYQLRAYGKRISGTAAGLNVVASGRNNAHAMVAQNAILLSWAPNTSGAGAYLEAVYAVPSDGSVTQLQVGAYLAHAAPPATEVWTVDAITLLALGNLTPKDTPGLAVDTVAYYTAGTPGLP